MKSNVSWRDACITLIVLEQDLDTYVMGLYWVELKQYLV
jgi:hypothetical protein